MGRRGSGRERALHLMMLPAVIIVLVYGYGPLLGIYIAFQDFSPAFGLFGSPWVGFGNFTFVFNVPGFLQVIWNTIFIAFLKILGMIGVPVFCTLLLNEITHSGFKRVVQTLIYLPNFLSWVVLAGLMIDILSPSTGIVNQFLQALGMKPIFFLGDRVWFPLTMVFSDIWKSFGYGTIIYLAALTSIDPCLYEAAEIDGAGRMGQIWHVTLPGILPIIVLMSVLSLGNILNAGFEQVFNLYSPQVYDTGDIIDTFVYRLGLQQAQFGPATAVGLFKSVISFLFVALSYILADRFVGYRIY